MYGYVIGIQRKRGEAMLTTTYRKITFPLMVLGLVLFFIHDVAFSFYFTLVLVILAIVTSLAALTSLVTKDTNADTAYQVSTGLSAFIIVAGFVVRLTDGQEIFHVDLFYIHIRFMVVFIILKAMILGTYLKNKNLAVLVSSLIDLVLIILFLTIISSSNEHVFLLMETKLYSPLTLLINFLLFTVVFHTKHAHLSERTKSYTINVLTISSLFLSDLIFIIPMDVSLTIILSQLLIFFAFLRICFESIEINIKNKLKLLNEQKDSFFDMFMSATDPIILFKQENNEWIIELANDAVTSLLEFQGKELKGFAIKNIFSDPLVFGSLDLDNPARLEYPLITGKQNIITAEISLHNFEMFGLTQHLMVVRDLTESMTNKDKVSLFETIFLNAHEAMFITDKLGHIKWINQSFEDLYGYGQEVLGRRVNVLKSGIHDANFYKVMWHSIHTKGQWSGEIWNRTVSGDLIPIHQNIFIIPEDHPEYAYASISYDLTESKLIDNKIYELAFIDPELGIKNRNSILEHVGVTYNSVIVLAQIKDLKNIELRFGTDFVLQLLRQTLENLSELVNRNNIFRYSENTFALILELGPNTTKDSLGQDILNSFSVPYEINTIQLSPTVFIGLSSGTETETTTIDRLTFEAESALTAANSSIISNYIIFSRTIEEDQIKSYDMLKAVENAVHNNEFEVYFQPIVDLFSGELFSFEALSRWEYNGAKVSPVEFIELAEKNNLIYDLGLQILRDSCIAVVSWKKIRKNIKVNVNVSLLQLEDGKFVESLKQILIDTHCAPSDLILEITESVSSISNPTIDQTIYDLHALGIIFALDDFGTGFSSIQRLKRMPISISKIDHDFTRDIHENVDDTSVITGMISMSHKIGLNVIVEGVENIDQLRIVRSRNCRYVQGYYFSKPIDTATTQAYIENYDPQQLVIAQLNVDLKPLQVLNEDSLTHNKNIGTALLDNDGFIVDSTMNFNAIIGENRSDVLGESINSFITDAKEDDIIVHSQLEEDIIEKSGTIRRLDGTIRYVIYNLYTDKDKNTSQTFIRCLIEDITEDLDIGLKLMRMRQGYEKIFINAPVMIITWNKDYKVLEWNQIAEDILGFSAHEVVEKSIFDTFVHTSDFKQWRQFVDMTLNGHESKLTLNVTDSRGISHVCECNNEIVRSSSGDIDFVITIMKDITDQLLAQERSDSLLSVIDNGPALVFMCRKNGEIWYRSKACLEIDQLKTVENIDDITLSYYDHLDNEIEPPNRSKVDMWTSTGSIQLSNEEERRVRVTIFKDEIAKLQDDLFIYIFMDFTNEYEQVRSVKRLKNIILDQERLAELGHLSAGIAHEINNPLSYMISSSDILKTELKQMYELIQVKDNESFEYLKSDIYEILSDFEDGLQRIKTIVTGLRTYSWGTKSDEFMMVDLNETIDKVLTIASNEIKYTANIKVNLDPLPNIEAIGSKLSQVILNLILNASNSIEKKHDNKMGTIKINTSSDDNYVYCTIEDDGINLSPDIENQLFDSHYTTKPDGFGTGLGLSISKEIVQDLHHGSIQVASTSEQGTKFIITLPHQQPKLPR